MEKYHFLYQENEILQNKLYIQNISNQNNISLILMSHDESIRFSIIYKSSNDFYKIEDIL